MSVVVLLAGVCLAGGAPAVAQQVQNNIQQLANNVQQVAASNVAFAQDLYLVLSDADPERNLIFSPLSVHAILSLVSLGARGATAQQMIDGLQLPTGPDFVKKGYKGLLDRLKGGGKTVLSVANKVYLQRSFPVQAPFLQTARTNFGSDVQTVDFVSSPEATRRLINKWVENQTQSKISELLPAGFVSRSTVLVLVNAVYFKGSWRWFDERATTQQPFRVPSGPAETVAMMHAEKHLPYRDDPEHRLQLLELPYDGNEVSLVIVLPYDVDGLLDLEEKLHHQPMSDFIRDLKSTKVRAYLPKFTLEETYDLEETLTQLGMGNMFSGQDANFLDITSKQVSISKVVHKAFIEVDEKGTEAAAATGVGIMMMSLPVSPPIFYADRPFLFLLRHNPTGTVLFMGRFQRP